MSENDFILDQITYSFSSVNSYLTCKYQFFLSYIKAEKRSGNFFGQFGSFIHSILQKYFNEELEIWDLAKYYEDNYDKEVIMSPPPYPSNMGETYRNDGLNFFENFEFEKEKYEVILIEDSIFTEYNGVKIIAKPDLVLKEKETGKYILWDYKTAKLKNDKYDKQKMEEYKKQFYLYVWALYSQKQIEISKIIIWFVRNGKQIEMEINLFEVAEIINWLTDTVEKIKKEEEWSPNLQKSNDYFCSWLCGCGLAGTCKYQNEKMGMVQ